MFDVFIGVCGGLLFAIFFPEPFSKLKAKVTELVKRATD